MNGNLWETKIGAKIRLSRIFARDSKTVILAADHRQRGLQDGMRDLAELSRKVSLAMTYADALLSTKDPLRFLLVENEDLARKGIILSLNRTGLAGSVFETDDRCVVSPQHSLRLGADGVKLLLRISPDSRDTSSQLELCGRISEECDKLQIPLILEPLYSRKTSSGLTVDTSPDKIMYASIIAADFSVSAIKIPYPSAESRSRAKKSLSDVVSSTSCPILVLGGGRTDLDTVLQRAEDSMDVGARGVVVGRNIILNNRPDLVACTLRRIVHLGEDAETALRQAEAEVSS